MLSLNIVFYALSGLGCAFYSNWQLLLHFTVGIVLSIIILLIVEICCNAWQLIVHDKKIQQQLSWGSIIIKDKLAVLVLGSFFKIYVEIGHMTILLRHGKLNLLFHRYDWLLGTESQVIENERSNTGKRCAIYVFILLLIVFIINSLR